MTIPRLPESELQTLAMRVIERSQSPEKRPETVWLEARYRLFLSANGLRNFRDGDALVSRRMSEGSGISASNNPSAILKVRYWRTGRHYPKNRAVCEAFGRALGLDEREHLILLTDWFDHADRSFGPAEASDPEYLRRFRILEKLKREFTDKQRPEELLAMCTPGTEPSANLRYIYCRQAVRYLGSRARTSAGIPISHLDTRGYDPQFSREMKLLGEVSRSTMIRHLLILGMPFVNRSRIDKLLTELGYTPLKEDHRRPGGEATDLLVLGLLKLYEQSCAGREPEECTEWFRQAAGRLSDTLDAAGCCTTDPFRFKHITGGRNV